MALTVKQLQEQRAPIGAEIRRMADMLGDSKPDFTAEERSKFDRLNTDFNALSTQIEAARSAERVDVEFQSRSGGPTTPGLEDTVPRSRAGKGYRAQVAEETRALAFQAWCRQQHGFELTDEQKRACKLVGLKPNRRHLDIDLTRRPNAKGVLKRAQSAQQPSAGAYYVSQRGMTIVEKALKDYNGARQVADVLRTEDGATMPWPTNDDTNNVGELIGENSQVSEQNFQAGVINFQAYKFSSKMIKVPSELMDDSAFDLEEFVMALLGERIGRKQEDLFTNGLGNSQPSGIVTGAKLGKTAAGATAITGDDIIDLIHSVDPAYRRDPSFRLMFHDLILAVIRKLKDSQGRYLFEEGQNGAPDKIKGVQYVINQNMDSTVASGKKTMLAGALRKFKIRDVKQLRLKRLDERYAELDQVAFIGFMRSDSRVLNAGTGPIKYLLQP